ncbi:MAG: hypothetical protein CMQ83_02765 [Gammaproteobacteria bacterium]|nr:hypothetical protein [Gammaproteobacteria bacterium]
MSKSNNSSSKIFEKKLDLLIKRFEEQKGIIDSYIKREREWKKDKLFHKKEVNRLEKILKKVTDE